jgi:alpha-beta hydrolase superfamily lysophospholipase
MSASTPLTLSRPDGATVYVNRWLPSGQPKAIVQIAHGMAEHSDRYARFAERLNTSGYAVYANDHRGHNHTAGSHRDTGYFADADGWKSVVGDLVAVTEQARTDHPGLPVFLFGHSMGSFLSRAYAADHGRDLAGLILSGTAGDPGLLGKVGKLVATVEGKLRGGRHRSGLMNTMSFGQYNSAFKPNRTEFDWLSRDDAEVDKYVADEWCGEVFTSRAWADLLGGLAAVNSDALVSRIPKDLPVHLLSGDKDPVGDNGKGVKAVAEQLRRLGVKDVTVKLYPEGRHEMLNETNRNDVMNDVVTWLDSRIPHA